MTLAPGIHEAVEAGVYHGAEVTDEPSLSASIAKILLTKSPLHAWFNHPQLNPDYQPTHSANFDLGTSVHAAFLEGDKFASKVATIDANDWRTKAAQEHRAAARDAGMTPLLTSEWNRVSEMVEAIRQQLAERDDDPPLFNVGKPEQTLIWEDEATGVICRARLDWLHDSMRAVDDLKSIPSARGSANPFDWQRTFWGIGADIEARFHSRGVRALTGRWPKFRFVVVETQAPYVLSVVDLAPSAEALADKKIERALAIWKDCLERDEWPGYLGTASIEVESYREADFLNRHWVPEDDERVAA